MQIKIYQINIDRDKHNMLFMPYDLIEKRQGTKEIDASIYDMVYESDIKAKNIEDVFHIFNVAHPKDYKGRSLSMSDIVEVRYRTGSVMPGFYYCDTFGFKKVDFKPDETVDAFHEKN